MNRFSYNFNSYLFYKLVDEVILDVNSIDPKQLARIRQQRINEQKRREIERYAAIVTLFAVESSHR